MDRAKFRMRTSSSSLLRSVEQINRRLMHWKHFKLAERGMNACSFTAEFGLRRQNGGCLLKDFFAFRAHQLSALFQCCWSWRRCAWSNRFILAREFCRVVPSHTHLPPVIDCFIIWKLKGKLKTENEGRRKCWRTYWCVATTSAIN